MLFPKDLQKAHDKAVDTINQLERELKRQTYEKRLSQIKKYDKEIDEFVFLVPKDLQEIVDEGNKLRHCVGNQNHLDRHAKGQTTIVFIRQKDKPNKPYFTMEYANQHVVQIQGKRNREEVPTNISQAVIQWEKYIKKIS
ncbi:MULTISPECIES: PcfJ domain-containing protein [Vagococcus]|uniref:PcfJ domain-containing protein n=1 Tax=Vagococcus TaxID=2737 RepID=UPI001F24FA23|nr:MULTISPECIES: PcfJ domain-containing protein [Vagococcus]